MQVDLGRVPKEELILSTGDILVIIGETGEATSSYLVTMNLVEGERGHVLVNMDGHSTYLEGKTLEELSQLVQIRVSDYRHFPCRDYQMTFVPD